jgi:hypothetical protein
MSHKKLKRIPEAGEQLISQMNVTYFFHNRNNHSLGVSTKLVTILIKTEQGLFGLKIITNSMSSFSAFE